jgi:hypothetical protein
MKNLEGGEVNNQEQRLNNAELAVRPQSKGRDLLIRVRYFDSVLDEEGKRHDVPVPASYPAADFTKVSPRANGDRIIIQYPVDEDESGQ